MPDDYYVSQYSGEEIDALLGGAGAGTVRYDAAQTLTDAQKTQARGNIEAAPDGFGLGKGIAHEVVPDCNDVKLSGLYIMSGNTTNYPTLIPDGQYSLLRVSARTASEILQEVFCIGIDGQYDFSAVRSYGNTGVWSPWEYINPPMQLGVEYRTTERYLGKPVYVRLVNFGNLGNATIKSVDVAVENVDKIPVLGGTAYEIPLMPGAYDGAISSIWATRTSAKITISITTTNDLSWMKAEVLLGYTKTTD